MIFRATPLAPRFRYRIKRKQKGNGWRFYLTTQHESEKRDELVVPWARCLLSIRGSTYALRLFFHFFLAFVPLRNLYAPLSAVATAASFNENVVFHRGRIDIRSCACARDLQSKSRVSPRAHTTRAHESNELFVSYTRESLIIYIVAASIQPCWKLWSVSNDSVVLAISVGQQLTFLPFIRWSTIIITMYSAHRERKKNNKISFFHRRAQKLKNSPEDFTSDESRSWCFDRKLNSI